MYQSGHDRHFNPVYQYGEKLAMLQPRKPFVEAEPAYEDISVRFWDYVDFSKPSRERVPKGVLAEDGLIKDTSHFEKGFFTGYDSRVFAYWNLLAGACGYTYGNNAIWQMYKTDDEVMAIPSLTDWRTAMDRPGGQSMRYVRNLFESRDFSKLQPDQSLIYGINPDGKEHIRAAMATDRSYAIFYLAVGQGFRVVMGKLNGTEVNAWWYNPANGQTKSIGKIPNTGIRNFTAPSLGESNDWVLVLDDSYWNYPAPGNWSKNN